MLTESLGLDISRKIARIYPKTEDHASSRSTLHDHLRLIGIRKKAEFNAQNAVIIDDVTTRGTQFNAMAHILRRAAFSGNLYALTLGKTREQYY